MPLVMPSPVNLALLICDQLNPKFHNGTTGDFYQRWLKNTHPPGVQPCLNIKRYNVCDGYEEYPDAKELRNLNAIMITGARDHAFNDDRWIYRLICFTQHIHNKHRHIRIFGICFGHQIIARALGGTVEPGEREDGLTAIRMTHIGKEVFGVDHILEIQQMHQDHVPLASLADHFSMGSLYLLGSTPRTPNQGFIQLYERCQECEMKSTKVHKIHEHIRIMTVQGHPEFVYAIQGGLVDKSGRFSDFTKRADFNEDKLGAETMWPWEYDGMNVGRAFWKVFGFKYDDAESTDHSDTSSLNFSVI